MSLSLVLGNLVGRSMISYMLVSACFVASCMRVRPAFARCLNPYALAAAVLLTMLGFAAAVVSGGGVR